MITYTVKVYDNGDIFWYNEKNEKHREDGPAEEYSGTKKWYKEGKLHREDGPACEWNDGSKSWYKEGKRHREDGPAKEYSNGYKQWYLNGEELTEEEFNNRNNSYLGKIVEIDGKKYKLQEV